MLISTSSKKTKRKEGGENHYSLTRLQQWKGGDKGEQRKQIIMYLKVLWVAKLALCPNAERCPAKSVYALQLKSLRPEPLT